MPAPKRHTTPYDNVLDTIGWTPLIRLNRVTAGMRTPVTLIGAAYALKRAQSVCWRTKQELRKPFLKFALSGAIWNTVVILRHWLNR